MIDPEAIREALAVLEYGAGDAGPRPWQTMEAVLSTFQAWQERQQADERGHARRRDESAREMGALLDLAEARRRTDLHLATRHS